MYGESYLSALLRQSYLIDQPANRRVATNDLHTVSRREMAIPPRRGRLKNKSAALEFRSCPVVVPSSNRRTGDWRSRADVSGATQVCLEGSKSLPCSCGGLTCGVPAMRQPGALPARCASWCSAQPASIALAHRSFSVSFGATWLLPFKVQFSTDGVVYSTRPALPPRHWSAACRIPLLALPPEGT